MKYFYLQLIVFKEKLGDICDLLMIKRWRTFQGGSNFLTGGFESSNPPCSQILNLNEVQNWRPWLYE